jgi:hypothetical protein
LVWREIFKFHTKHQNLWDLDAGQTYKGHDRGNGKYAEEAVSPKRQILVEILRTSSYKDTNIVPLRLSAS